MTATPATPPANRPRETSRSAGVSPPPSPYLTPAHIEHREQVRDFALREVKPIAREHDRQQSYPWATVRRMGDLGYLGVHWAPEYGGLALDELSTYITMLELARIDASHGLICSVQNGLDATMLMAYGSPAQQLRYVPLLARGRALGAFGLTEVQAGSDASATQTFAEDKGDHYVVNGAKAYITQAGVAEVVIAAVRTSREPGNRSMTALLMSKETCDLPNALKHGVGHVPDLPRTPGLRYGRTWEKMGWRAVNWGELVFENAIVPKENVLGRVGEGYKQFLNALDAGRIAIAAVALGIAEGAFDEALAYAGTRTAFGKKIGANQGVSFQLADMATDIAVAKQMLYHAAWLKQHGHPYKTEAAQVKLFCSELAMRTTTQAVQVFGGIGYTNDVPVERMMRDAKVCEIGEGTSEILRMVIARQLLGDAVNG